MRAQAVQEASRRIALVRIALLVAFLTLAARATHLTLVDSRAGDLGENQSLTRIHLAPARGGIFDRDRKALALTIAAPSVYASPTELENPDHAVLALSRILDLDRRKLAERLEGRRSFTYLARWVTPEQAARVDALELAGVGIVHEPRRAYPAGPLAGRLLGFANIDGAGVRGIEQQEDSWLRGQRRSVAVERDAKRRLLSSASVAPQVAAGGDVALSIDAAMQAAAESALRETLEKSGARGGIVISMNPRSGELLALAEEPHFDPNAFRDVAYDETRSRAFLDAVEPGSTLKVFLVAAALDAGAVSPDTSFDCNGGTYSVKGKTFRDHEDYGQVDLGKLITVSSNCGAVQLAEQLGPQLHYAALLRFGFGRRTGSGFPFESSGLLRHWKNWKPIDHATVAFGQGVSVTPVQLASAMSALANGGVWLPPRLVVARRSARSPWHPEATSEGRRILSEQTARATLKMMEGVVSPDGTGRRAGLRDLQVAGKTGTAQKFDAETGRYSQKHYTAWFMGAVPADSPRLVVVAAVDEPQGLAHGGGDVAAPLFARVAANHLAHLGIISEPKPIRPRPVERPEHETRSVKTEATPAPSLTAAKPVVDATPTPDVAAAPPAFEKSRPKMPAAAKPPRSVLYRPASLSPDSGAGDAAVAPTVFVPEFRGSTLSEVKRIAAESVLEVELMGRGLAVEQDPAPGTVLRGSERRVRIRFDTAMEES